MDRETLKEHLKQTLRKMTLEEFASLFINETLAIEEFFKLCHNVNAGKTISLLFNPHRLDIITEASVTRTSNPMSIYASLSDEGNDEYTEKIDGLARLYLYNLEHGTANPFYCTVQRGYNGVAYVNEFPPFVARRIYNEYNAVRPTNLKVLDPCCGWGGRMIGCASIPNTTYVGCEPCTKTYEGLVKLGNWLKSLQPTFEFYISNCPYEEWDLQHDEDKNFDIALTSPPYYNTEHYTDEPSNSMNKYDTYEKWVDGFYRPLITKTVSYLKPNGLFILNIGDRKYPLSDSMAQICESEGIAYKRTTDYLSGNGEAKEKFYCLSKADLAVTKKMQSLF